MFLACNIPDEMKAMCQWVLWARLPMPDGKVNKIPINPRTGNKAQSNNPNTWTNFDTAAAALKRNEGTRLDCGVISGLGFMLLNSGITCIDLDHIDGREITAYQDGKPNTDTVLYNILLQLNVHCYAEISQSGRGIHIFVKGKLPAGRRKHNGIEMYDDAEGKARFIAMTGNLLHNTHTALDRDMTTELKALHEKYMPQTQSTPSAGTGSNPLPLPLLNVDIQKALDTARRTNRKFNDLWAGDLTAYAGDESRADQALCDILCFYLGGDPAKIDAAFRQSGLMRDKWDRKTGSTTYGKMTIDKAINDSSGYFDYSRDQKKIIRDENRPRIKTDRIRIKR